MKHIVYLANIRLPTEKAHGIQIMKTCEALARAGAKVTLVVTNRKTIKADPFDYYKVERNFKIKYAYCPEFIFLGKFGFFLMNVIFSQSCAYHVWKESPDIVYSRDYLLLLDQMLWSQKKVWEVHDGIWGLAVQMMNISGIVAISNGLKQFYEQRAYKKIVVAHDAVDISEFTVDQKADLGFESDKKIVMYIGHMYGWKGVDTFLEASTSVPNAQFVVIGGVREDYPNVKFLGYKPYNELPKNQKAADILVIPNSGKTDISRLYTSPLKVFSYMTSGVPIVASDLPSLREILNESNAFFADPDDPESFAKTIHYVLQHPDEARKKAEQAYVDVQKYTWDARARTILDFFAKI